MDDLPYVKVRHEGKRIGEAHLGQLKHPFGSRKQQDKFLLTAVYSEVMDDGSWFTDQTYTFNSDGWDTDIYRQSYSKLTLWDRCKMAWVYCFGS